MEYTNLYYFLKPLIPRLMQLWLRRANIFYRKKYFSKTWPINPGAGQVPRGFPGWPQKKRFALVLTHDVETQKGQDRCINLMNLEKSLHFISSFNFVPERYKVNPELRNILAKHGFEIGVHGLRHNGELFASKSAFDKLSPKVNNYLNEWNAVGFRAPSMISNLAWINDLNIEYDSSTFDTDPFEPTEQGVATIFPFYFQKEAFGKGYIELPYTLPQDFTLFILLREKNLSIWKEKVRWIADHGGMVLLDAHPDYMNFSDKPAGREEYPASLYKEFLEHIQKEYAGKYWNVLPREIARFWKKLLQTPHEPDGLPQVKTPTGYKVKNVAPTLIASQ